MLRSGRPNMGLGRVLAKDLVQDKLLAYFAGRGEALVDLPTDVDTDDSTSWQSEWETIAKSAGITDEVDRSVALSNGCASVRPGHQLVRRWELLAGRWRHWRPTASPSRQLWSRISRKRSRAARQAI